MTLLRDPLISIIIPTKNSSRTLDACFSSIKKQTYTRFEVIVVDNHSADQTVKIAEAYNCRVFSHGPERSAQRNYGAREAHGQILFFVDSDMELEDSVLADVAGQLAQNFDALVVPERSFGTSFWAECKRFEKKCYEGVEQIESVRVIRRDVFDHVGQFDTEMIFSEDKDLDIRIREGGFKIGRIASYISHNEGNLSLLQTCKKKVLYSATANIFAQKHPTAFRWQGNILIRYWLFFKRFDLWSIDPVHFLGLLVLKTSEYFFSFIGLCRSRFHL